MPITQTVTEAGGLSSINSTGHLRAAPPSNQKRGKYGKKLIQQDATYFPEMGRDIAVFCIFVAISSEPAETMGLPRYDLNARGYRNNVGILCIPYVYGA